MSEIEHRIVDYFGDKVSLDKYKPEGTVLLTLLTVKYEDGKFIFIYQEKGPYE